MKTILIFFLLFTTLYAQKTLTVLTRNAPTILIYSSDGRQVGFEHDLVMAFAKEKGYKVNFVIKDSIKDLLRSLKKGEGDFAAAGLTSTEIRRKEFLVTPGYFTVQEQVICGNRKRPKNIDELKKYKIQIIAKSSYAETMQTLKKDHPSLKWGEHEGYTTEHIFEQIHKKKIDCTIADSDIIAINRRYFPSLEVAFPVSQERSLAWMLPRKNQSLKLYKELSQWLQNFKNSKQYLLIKDRYFAYTEFFDYVDLSVYHKKIKTILPKYIDSFRRAGKKYKLDWRLLAAQAYQESHWNPKAKSPTGVRGMMMLTRATAKQLGVSDRLNYRYSIEGGAKYMRNLLRRTSDNVKNKFDRYKFALASYNIGMGHMYDAIHLGKKIGKDPYNWMNMRKILPLLADRKYYKQLRYGYARGNEPVRYVRRINTYYDILRQYYKN